MDGHLSEKLDTLEAKVDAMYSSVEKLRKYFLWTFWITVILFVAPLIGLMFAIPMFMNSYVGALYGNIDSGNTHDTGGPAEEIQMLQELLN